MIDGIYFDMDGVLCDMDKALFEKTGCHRQELEEHDFWGTLESPGFFESLPPMEDLPVLFEYLRGLKYTPIGICSSAGTGSTFKSIAAQKCAWLLEEPGCPHFELGIHIMYGGQTKRLLAKPSTVLVDDTQKVLDRWLEAGGIGILHTSAESTIEQLRTLLET